jgi:hypothetical protein
MAVDGSNLDSGWVLLGTWTLPPDFTPPRISSFSPASGAGISQRFSLNLWHSSTPPGTLANIYILFNNILDGRNACFVWYNGLTRGFGLVSNDGLSLIPGSTAENSQCILSETETSNYNGTTVNFRLTFKSQFGGIKNAYLRADSVNGVSTGWQVGGTWGIPEDILPPISIQSYLSSSSGGSGTLRATFTHVYGLDRIDFIGLLVNSTLNGVNACFVLYFPSNGKFGLLNDAGTTYQIYGTNVPSNSQCTIQSAYQYSGYSSNSREITVTVLASPTFRGLKNIYGYGKDYNGRVSGWEWQGSWNIP